MSTGTQPESRRRSPQAAAVSALLAHRLVRAGLVLLGILVLAALLAPVLTRAGLLPDAVQQDAAGLAADGLPMPPDGRHLLGTDNLGRDVLSRALHGARISLSVGVAAMLTATLIGLPMGLLAGFYGGWPDHLLMRFTDVNMSIPSVLLAVALAGLMDGQSVLHLHPASWDIPWLDFRLQRGPTSIFLLIGFVSWPGMVRVIRGQVLTLREREYVTASRGLGASDARLLVRHILPNLLPTVVVLSVMSIGNMMLLEAGLGYLNIGVPPPAPTLGSMILGGQDYLVAAPWIVMVPGLVIVLAVLGFNLLGQGLQEVLDPRSRP